MVTVNEPRCTRHQIGQKPWIIAFRWIYELIAHLERERDGQDPNNTRQTVLELGSYQHAVHPVGAKGGSDKLAFFIEELDRD
jgi:hypothetical protein